MYFIEKFERRETGIKHPKSFEKREPSLYKKNVPEKLISGVATQKCGDDLQKVKILVTVLYDLLKVYGYGDQVFLSKREKAEKGYSRLHSIKTKKDKKKLIDRYYQFVLKAGFGSWKDLFKYKINAFFSHVMKQDVPPSPQGLEEFPDLLDPSFMFYGRAKRFLYQLKCDKNMYENFAQSVAQSKKGAPPVHPEVVYEAEVKCFEHLTSEHPNKDDFIIEHDGFNYPINQHALEFELRRTIREFLGKKLFMKMKDLNEPFVPSTSSQYNNDRGGMGAVGAFRKNQSIMKRFWRAHLLNDEPLIKKELGSVTLSQEQSELYGLAGREDQILLDSPENGVKDTIGLLYDGSKLRKIWREDIYPEMVEQAMLENPDTVIIGLPEPLKVRCITAGPPITYSVLKPVQKWLWKKLKKNKVFRLIGEPVSEEIVKDQLGELGPGEEFISGDYKASTDNLHSWVSECLLDELLIVMKENSDNSNIPEEEKISETLWGQLRVLMLRSLTGHFLLHPEMMETYRRNDMEMPPREELLASGMLKPQKEGQLMGSIISFIFLCLANAAFCRRAMEIASFRAIKVFDRRIAGHEIACLLINGDDCVFKGIKDKLFVIWKDIAGFGGLESSVGKTFKSKNFLTINSCQYSYSVSKSGWEDLSGLSREEIFYKEIKYVNLALIYGQKKDGIRGKQFYKIGALSRDLHRTCPIELIDRAATKQLYEASRVRYEPVMETIMPKYDEFDRNIECRPKVVPKFRNGLMVIREIPLSNIKTARLPYHLPEWLGGLGIVPFKGHSASKFDVMQGLYIRDSFQQLKPRHLGDIPQWNTHKIANSLLEEYSFLDNQNYLRVSYKDQERSLPSEFQTLYNLCLCEAFLTCRTRPNVAGELGFSGYESIDGIKVPFKENFLYDPENAAENFNRRQMMKAVRKNRLVFQTAREELQRSPQLSQKFGSLYGSFDISEFDSERKEFSMSCFNLAQRA